ncbi:MAG: hypothetical protein M1826_005911 [Phylliscum demangeonii]|nr:MAG: hypothetical protein M1826_005911 [Phylliscum demangeonii]
MELTSAPGHTSAFDEDDFEIDVDAPLEPDFVPEAVQSEAIKLEAEFHPAVLDVHVQTADAFVSYAEQEMQALEERFMLQDEEFADAVEPPQDFRVGLQQTFSGQPSVSLKSNPIDQNRVAALEITDLMAFTEDGWNADASVRNYSAISVPPSADTVEEGYETGSVHSSGTVHGQESTSIVGGHASDQHVQLIKVLYKNLKMSLFPPLANDPTKTYFLREVYLADENMLEVFKAMKAVLGNTIDADDELELGVESLDLYLGEESVCAQSTTLRQIVDLYLQLMHQDGIDDPSPMHIRITVQAGCLKRLKELRKAADEGNGISALSGWDDDNQHATNEGGQLNENVEVDQEAQETEIAISESGLAREPGEVHEITPADLTNDGEGGVDLALGIEGEHPHTQEMVGEKASQPATAQRAPSKLTPPRPRSEISSGQENPKADNISKAVKITDDDLIDYDDDDEDVLNEYRARQSLTSQAAGLVIASTETDEHAPIAQADTAGLEAGTFEDDILGENGADALTADVIAAHGASASGSKGNTQHDGVPHQADKPPAAMHSNPPTGENPRDDLSDVIDYDSDEPIADPHPPRPESEGPKTNLPAYSDSIDDDFLLSEADDADPSPSVAAPRHARPTVLPLDEDDNWDELNDDLEEDTESTPKGKLPVGDPITGSAFSSKRSRDEHEEHEMKEQSRQDKRFKSQ